MAEQNWSLRGEYMESCNCDYLCPCIYTNPQGPATHDHCTAVMAFRIDEGKLGRDAARRAQIRVRHPLGQGDGRRQLGLRRRRR